MQIIDPATGKPYFRKQRRRYHEFGDARELTFSCYKGYAFLARDRTRIWFLEALQEARQAWPVDLWAYVLMPEHVHLLVWPRAPGERIVSGFLQAVKEPIARRAIAYLERHAPAWLPRLTIREGKRTRRRFWQPGGGYDRNVAEAVALRAMIDYLHANPVRRGLVERAEDWEWSSARWYAGIRPARIEMDLSIVDVLAVMP
jgi:putative transposase